MPLKKRYAPAWVLLLVGLLISAADALPPPRPGLVDPQTRTYLTTGQKVPVFPEQVRSFRVPAPGARLPTRLRAPAVQGAAARPMAIDTKAVSAVRPLVLLIDFVNRPAALRVASKSVFAGIFFGAGATDLSVRNYWSEVSYGAFTVSGTAADINPGYGGTGWLRAGTAGGGFPTTITSSADIAGLNPTNVRTLIADAVAYLAGLGADFTPYVNPADRSFYAVILVQPGYGAEDSGDVAQETYSHSSRIDNIVTAAGNIVDYSVVPSIQYYSDPTPGIGNIPDDDPPIGIGVIVHEMGHLLGLPDLYPTSPSVANTFAGAGVFDLMAQGMWGSNLLLRADVPAHPSAWSKYRLGWLTPRLVGQGVSTPRLPPVELQPVADKVLSNSDADPTQYFLVENRQITSTLGTWLFDKHLTEGTGAGAGCLIWQIDEEVINLHLATNTVNDNATFRGVSVKEADGVGHMGLPFPAVGGPNDRAPYYGDAQDYFPTVFGPPSTFDRSSPSATVNSAPIVDNTYSRHPFDFGSQVSMFQFTRTPANEMDYVISVSPGTGAGANWKTFNIASSQVYPLGDAPPAVPEPMRSDDILSVAFDSGNNAWMGSRGEGIFRFLGTRFEFLAGARGLPSGNGTPVARIQAMAFEQDTGSMWVATDRGVYKMRDSGSGFRVVTSFSSAAGTPVPGGDNVQAVAVRGGFLSGSTPVDIKYVGSAGGLVRVYDENTDAPAGDVVIGILAADVTAIAIDDGGTPGAADDIVWVGTRSGTLYRSLLETEIGGPASGDPVRSSHFKQMAVLTGNPAITSLAVDKSGILWIGTDGRGIQAFDLGETISKPNLRDPYDFNGDSDKTQPAYLDFVLRHDVDDNVVSNRVTGITFQEGVSGVVAWIAHRTLSGVPGGASRIDLKLTDVLATPTRDERLKVYSPIPPAGQAPFGTSVLLTGASADSAGNVWFATSDLGVVRFGNAGIVSLDSSNYVNVSALAVVTVQDDGLNTSPTTRDSAFVRVVSTLDIAGFVLILRETGPDTGVFRGTFGFTTAPPGDSTGSPPLILVSGPKTTVTVTYVDTNPPRAHSATATWKSIFPFEDRWVIEDFRCFIATAAYGSPMSPDVAAFRRFRDAFLMPSAAGRALVAAYYRASPAVAAWIAPRPAWRALARFALAPAALFAGFAAGAGFLEKTAVALFVAACIAPALAPRRRGRAGAGVGRAPS